MKYFKYLSYLLRHKWYVFLECCSAGIPWRGVWHDFSKFYPDEFLPYAEYFYGQRPHTLCGDTSKTASSREALTGDAAFDLAWLKHQHRNTHHWQWYVLEEDSGVTKVLEMSDTDRQEMVCDWVGAGKAQGFFSPPEDPFHETRAWYKKNRSKMKLHPGTEGWIECRFGIEEENNQGVSK